MGLTPDLNELLRMIVARVLNRLDPGSNEIGGQRKFTLNRDTVFPFFICLWNRRHAVLGAVTRLPCVFGRVIARAGLVIRACSRPWSITRKLPFRAER